MAKRSALARSVAAFNKRLSRAIRRDPEAANYLPEKVKARELKAGIKTVQERQRVIKELNRFQAPQMKKVVVTDKGFKATAWEVAAAKRYNERANRARKQELAIRTAMPQNFKTKTGELEKLRLKPRAVNIEALPNTAKGREAWQAFVRAERHIGSEKYLDQKAENYKAFYLGKLRNNLTGPGAQQAINLVKSLPARVIYAGQYNDPMLKINSLYPSPTLREQQAELNSLVTSHWREMAQALS